MAKTIKIKCNGPQRHLNEVDLDQVLARTRVVRGPGARPAPEDWPERVVRPCRECTAGKVVITRAMIEDAFSTSSDGD